MPLYLAVSPALYVQDDTEACIWLKEQILEVFKDHGVIDFSGNVLESLGVLVQATDPAPIKAISTDHAVTEILFYAEASADGQIELASGSIAAENIIVRALPLSSHLLYAAANFPAEAQSEIEPASIPDPPNQQAPIENNLNAIFDSAADLSRKRRKGGSSISLAASRGTSQPQSPLIKPEPEDESTLSEYRDHSLPNENVLQGRYRRRSPPTAGARATSSAPASMRPPSRPSSRTGLDRKRSSLSVMQTAEDSSFDSRNRQTITKTVMAGMRMYGLQQRKAGEGQMNSESVPETASNDEEYKLVYHQTFKGTVFALRREMGVALVRPDAVREVVDRLLAVFCGEVG